MSLDEHYTKIEAKKKASKDKLDASKKHWEGETKRLLGELRQLVPKCGLTEKQLSEFSGVVPSTIKRVMNSRFTSARFDSVVQILGAAGYRIEIVELAPKEDFCRSERMFHLPPVEE
jgi:predicted XRE-type DNA-binding protein